MSINHLCGTCPTNVFRRACLAVRQAQTEMIIFHAKRKFDNTKDGDMLINSIPLVTRAV